MNIKMCYGNFQRREKQSPPIVNHADFGVLVFGCIRCRGTTLAASGRSSPRLLSRSLFSSEMASFHTLSINTVSFDKYPGAIRDYLRINIMEFKRLYNSINYKGIVFGHLTKIKELFSQTYSHVSVDCVSEFVSWFVNVIFVV